MRPWRWWASLSQVQRFDIYMRWSHYLALAVLAPMPLLLLNGNPAVGPGSFVVLGAVCAALAVVCMRLIRDGYADEESRPSRPVAVAAGLTVAGGVLAVGLSPDPEGHGWLAAACLVLMFICALLLVASTLVCIAVTLSVIVIPPAADAVFPGLMPPGFEPGWVVTLTAASLAVIGGVRGNVWVLRIVRELDRARAAQARLAVAEERLRFARDLHDVLGNRLSLVALKSDLAAQLARRGRPDAVDEMLAVRQVAQDLLAEMREVVSGYRGVSLAAELAGARSVLASAGAQCRVIGETAALPEGVQVTLGWVVREGVTNILRHSAARMCSLELRRVDGGLVFTVDNDGVSSPSGSVTPGSGLRGLTERLGAVGGTLEATYRDEGFVLTARVPLSMQDVR
jgi:two-component system sensor histidine kinase DesK